MGCPACEVAEQNPWCGHFRSDCQECAARMLAHGPSHFESAKALKLLPAYWDALSAVFGKGAEQAGQQRVKRWGMRLQEPPIRSNDGNVPAVATAQVQPCPPSTATPPSKQGR